MSKRYITEYLTDLQEAIAKYTELCEMCEDVELNKTATAWGSVIYFIRYR